MRRNPFPVIAALAVSLLAGLAHAQSPEEEAPYGDPPDRAARLAYLDGEVSLQPAGEEEWAPALLNRPLTTGDRLWTERGARAEIQVGRTAIRLDGGTGFSFLNLDDQTTQMRLTAGVVIVDVRELAGREHIEIDTPNLAVSILSTGSYRVEVNDAGDVTTVKIGGEGEAEANGPSQNVLVRSRQVVTFRGMDNLVANWGTLGPADAFDEWSMERERRGDRLASSRASEYVSPDVTGYEELDDYGTWSSEPEYGYVWTPSRVAVDWSPYRYGRWVWVSPWGWTWIDDAPWGYAPFHYGRWAHIRHRWCWVPGPRHVRAVYAPALVGWYGGHGLHVSWYPLGPRDVYVPGRRFSRHYWERVNFANTRIIDRGRVRDAYDRRGHRADFRERFVAGAVTAATRDAFRSGQRIGERRARVNGREYNGNHDGSAPQDAPGRDSRHGGQVRARPRVPAALADRQVVVRRDPPAAAARFTRPPAIRTDDNVVAPERNVHPRVRVYQDRRNQGELLAQQRTDQPRAERPRADRPPRTDQPVNGTYPRRQSSVFDEHAIAERVRQDRDRQVREAQQRQRRDESEAQQSYARRRPAESYSTEQQQPRAQERVYRQREQGQREQGQREQGQREQAPTRQREERVRMDNPRVERPRSEPREVRQPREERAHRPSAPPPENRSTPRRSNEHPRAKRN